MRHNRFPITVLTAAAAIALLLPGPSNGADIDQIKAYCLDFNWGSRGKLAEPGAWCNADPAQHVAWYKAMGANVIQTFCVSTNGYAWYKNGPVPEQPGLKHDFLREVVKLGHAKGMLVFGYFTIGSNPRWGKENPGHYYPGGRYNIVYSDAYLDYLSQAIGDAVKTTGIDGFMLDWVWMPNRKTKDNPQGKWLEAEKKLYAQLMGEPFPGEDKLTRRQDLAYSRKAIDRCWKTIRKAAKAANPDCIIWLTSNNLKHPAVVNSDMYRQTDWLMCETGNLAHIQQIKDMVGKHTRLITCMAQWNGQDPTAAVPEAHAAGVGLYGFAKPRNNAGLIPLDKILTRQVSELSGDDQNIAVLARAYHGRSLHSIWKDGRFVEPNSPPPLAIRFRRRGRGWQDTASVEWGDDQYAVNVRTPYQTGRAQLTRTGDTWPKTIEIRLSKYAGRANANVIRMANGKIACALLLDGKGDVTFGKWKGKLDLGQPWGEKFAVVDAPDLPEPPKVQISQADKMVTITVPNVMTAGNPESLTIEWSLTLEARIR